MLSYLLSGGKAVVSTMDYKLFNIIRHIKDLVKKKEGEFKKLQKTHTKMSYMLFTVLAALKKSLYNIRTDFLLLAITILAYICTFHISTICTFHTRFLTDLVFIYK